jgi:hypothetical protein
VARHRTGAGPHRCRHAGRHPQRWLLALAERIEGAGGTIVEGVRATGVSGHTAETTRGPVRARDVVVATHYPILDRGLFFGSCPVTLPPRTPRPSSPARRRSGSDSGASLTASALPGSDRLETAPDPAGFNRRRRG